MLDQITKTIKHQDCCPDRHLERVNASALYKLVQAFLREEIFPASHHNNQLIFTLTKTSSLLVVDTIEIGALARYKTFGKVYRQDKNNTQTLITRPEELLAICSVELNSEYDDSRWQNFSKEINDHLRNALLTSYKSCAIRKKIAQDAIEANCNHIDDWLTHWQRKAELSVFFEQWASRGHPYHPCCKTKLGFSLQDVVNYSPEFHPQVGIIVAAVRKDYLHIETMQPHQDYCDWFAAEYPGVWTEWRQALLKRKLCADDYSPMPIHPWQAQNKVGAMFAEYIAAGVLHLLDEVRLQASPTLSFRTLAPSDYPECAYVKLPVAVQATSVYRTLSPASTVNTPRISRLLQAILADEANFDGILYLLNEIYGLHLKTLAEDMGKHLTAIYRENPDHFFAEGETNIVVAALFEKSPVTDVPLMIDLMNASGVNDVASALAYFARYVQIVLGGYLDLYLIYGISLEGHQQNTLAVFNGGEVARFIARDFDGIEIHAESLQKRGKEFTAYPGSASPLRERRQVRNQLLHTVYQAHLGELVLLIADHYQCDDKLFWRIIKDVTEQRFAALEQRMDRSDWQREYQAILAADWSCKALFRMRLQTKYNPEGLFYKIANPLVCAD